MTVGRISVAPAPGPLRGTVRVPGDKSIAHRAIILNAAGKGTAMVYGLPDGLDVASSLSAMRALGTEIDMRGPDAVSITGRALSFEPPESPLDCGNSGTTLRLLTGLLVGQSFESVLDGDDSLRRRPMGRVTEPLATMGGDIDSSDGGAPIRIRGARLRGVSHQLEVASAQVKSALLLAGLKADGRTSVTEPALSRDHTERMLRAMGVEVQTEGLSVSVQGPSLPECVDIELCGDPSSAAFIAVAALLTPGSDVSIENICLNPTRTGFVDILRRMGADLEITRTDRGGVEPVGDLRARGSRLVATEIEAAEIPGCIDELPVIAVAASTAEGVTRISGASELRVKESDRIAGVTRMLTAIGASVSEHADGMEIEGVATPPGGVEIDAAGDHRLAMAAAVAALNCRRGVSIVGAESVAVSYPGFFERMGELGG